MRAFEAMTLNHYSKNLKNYSTYAFLFFSISLATFIIVREIILMKPEQDSSNLNYFLIPLIFTALSIIWFVGYFHYKKT